MSDKKVVAKAPKTESTAKAASDKKKVTVTARTYDVLRRPILSEKSAKLSETGALAFEVAADATKKDVANAVKAIYNVTPEKINILNVKGKIKNFRQRTGTQKAVKKAYITLKEGDKIELANATA